MSEISKSNSQQLSCLNQLQLFLVIFNRVCYKVGATSIPYVAKYHFLGSVICCILIYMGAIKINRLIIIMNYL